MTYVSVEINLDEIDDDTLIRHLGKNAPMDKDDLRHGRKFSEVMLDVYLHCKKTGRVDLAARVNDHRDWLLKFGE